MFQIQRIDIECIDEMRPILEIHGRTVEIDQHPFMRIEIERLSMADAVQ